MGPKLSTKKLKMVSKWEKIEPGMPLYLKYHGLWHAIIVTGTNPDDGYVYGIHYGCENIISTRTISEDAFQVNVSEGQVWRRSIPKCKMVDPDVAVRRARAKIGNQTFNILTSRSSHFVTECIMK